MLANFLSDFDIFDKFDSQLWKTGGSWPTVVLVHKLVMIINIAWARGGRSVV